MSSPSDPPLLDRSMLARYEGLLLEQGIPFRELTRPGLSEAEMAQLSAPLPMTLSSEARTWWGWRDGAGPGRPAWSFGPGRHCLSLSAAVREYWQDRQSAERIATEPGLSGPRSDPDFMWRPGWLPILPGGQLKTALDCDVAEGEPSPISFIDVVDQPEEYARHKARSLGEMIGWWCLALEVGAWSWDAQDFRWHEDDGRLPPELQGSPLV